MDLSGQDFKGADENIRLSQTLRRKKADGGGWDKP